MTPYHQSHSTTIAGMHNVAGGDNRFYNNIFVGKGESATPGKAAGDDPERAGAFGLWVYDARTAPLSTGGNVYYNGAELYAHEEKDAIRSGDDPKIKIAEENGNVYLSLPSVGSRTMRRRNVDAVGGEAEIAEWQAAGHHALEFVEITLPKRAGDRKAGRSRFRTHGYGPPLRNTLIRVRG